MADEWFDIDKIKAAMKKAANGPVAFGFAVAGKPEDGKMAMSPKRSPEFLGKALKKEGFKPNRILIGTATLDGTKLIVTCEAEVPKAVKAIKYYLLENQLKAKKVLLIGPNGEFDADDDDADAGGATAAQGAKAGVDQAAKTASAGGDQDAEAARKSKLQETLKKLAPYLQQELKTADDVRKAALMKGFEKARNSLANDDFATTETAIKDLLELLKSGAAKPAAETKVDKDAIKAQKSTLEKQLNDLLTIVKATLPATGAETKAAILAHVGEAKKALTANDNVAAEAAIKDLAKTLTDFKAMQAARKSELTDRLKKLQQSVDKELPDADRIHAVAMTTPIEQAETALAKGDYATAELAINNLDKVLKGTTAAPRQATPMSPADQASDKAFQTVRGSAWGKLTPHMKDKSVAPQVLEYLRAFKSADQAAKDKDWGAAQKLIIKLDGELDGLAKRVADERDAEEECKAQLKHLIGRISDYQKLDKQKQDAKMLSEAAGTIKTIQEKMKSRSFAAAQKDIEQFTRKLAEANTAANWGEAGGKAKKGREGRRLKEEEARQQKVALKEFDVRVQAETLGEALSDPAVKALMTEHRKLIKGEAGAFKGYRWMDEVQAALDAARDTRDEGAVKAMTKQIQAMGDAIGAAQSRQSSMFKLLGGIKQTPDNADALKEAREFARTMTNHISDTWLTEGPRLAQRLPMMLKSGKERKEEFKKAKDISDNQRVEERALFKEVIEHGSHKGADRTQFYFDEPFKAVKRDTMDERAVKKAAEATSLLAEYQALDASLQNDVFISEMKAKIDSASKEAKDAQAKLKKMRDSNAPDPEIGKGLMKSNQESEQAIDQLRKALKTAGKETPDTKDAGSQYERLMKTYDEMIQRAYKIRDLGGSVEDVEASMKHVPPEFWPPQFIRNLQAWRKVERELAEERVQELFASDKFTFDDAVGCLSFAKEIYGTLGLTSGLDGAITGSNDENGWMDVPQVAQLIEGYISTIQDGFGLGTEGVTALQSLDFSGFTSERASDLYDNAANATKALIGVVTNIKNVPGIPEAGVFAKEVVPILSAIAAGIDLSIALNALRKSVTMRVKTGMLKGEADLAYFSGEMKDGGAMVKAIVNERDARNRQVAKKTTDVASKTVVVAGEATKAAVGAGWGTEQAVGHGLVVAGKAIEYGGKIVFAGIDWGVAQQAKKLIAEAQAGNPIARLEIMENSGLYAKMYIAILAKEGNKLALKFIDQRGYDERSVMKPAVSLQILREAMLAHADQRDETQVSDSLALELTESVTGSGVTKAVKMAGKGAMALGKKIKDLPKDKNIEYDTTWKPSKDADLSTANWQANKKDCIKNAGLYDESTGVDKAMKPCADLIKAATDAMDKYKSAKSISSTDREKIIAQVRKAQATIHKAMQVIADYYPGTNQGDLHQPMADYLVDLRRVLGTASNQLDLGLTTLKLINHDWTPPKKPGTTAADWETNWANAVVACDLPKQDGGVGKALHAYEAASGKLTGLSGDKIKEIRQARIVVRDALGDAAAAVKGLWPTCTSFPGMTDYLDQLLDHLLSVSQINDHELNGFDWDQGPFKIAANPFTAATWLATYKAADKLGFVNSKKGDCGMEKALKGWESNVLSKPADEVKKLVASKDLVKKRKEAIKVVAEIARSAEKLAAANPDAHSDFLQYIADLRREAHKQVAQFSKDQDDTSFAITKVLSTHAWKQVYDAGVEAGAIPKNDKAFKQLNKAIEEFEKVLNVVKTAKKPKDAFAAALKAQGKAADIQQTLTSTNGTDGWSNNLLLEFLDFVRDEAQAEIEAGVVAQVLSGENAKFDKPSGFVFKNKGGWQDVKKKAVEAGIIADAKSNFGKTIDQYLDAVKKRDAAKKKQAKQPEVYKGTFDIVLSRLSAIEGVANNLAKQTKNANFLAYLANAGVVCRTEIRAQQDKAPA